MSNTTVQKIIAAGEFRKLVEGSIEYGKQHLALREKFGRKECHRQIRAEQKNSGISPEVADRAARLAQLTIDWQSIASIKEALKLTSLGDSPEQLKKAVESFTALGAK